MNANNFLKAFGLAAWGQLCGSPHLCEAGSTFPRRVGPRGARLRPDGGAVAGAGVERDAGLHPHPGKSKFLKEALPSKSPHSTPLRAFCILPRRVQGISLRDKHHRVVLRVGEEEHGQGP